MLKTYFTILFRNFIKNRTFTLINITGLTLGLLCCMFIYLFVSNEFNFDRHFKQVESIYRLTTEGKGSVTILTSLSALPWASNIKKSLPEVEETTRLFKLPGTDQHLFKLMDHGQVKESFFERNGFLVDTSFFSVFSYEFILGNPGEALIKPYSLVLSSELSIKYFGADNPLGRLVR